MKKALNLRLFTKTYILPQWRSGYMYDPVNPKVPGSNSAKDLLFPFFLIFLFSFVLFAYLFCCVFFCFFVFIYILI